MQKRLDARELAVAFAGVRLGIRCRPTSRSDRSSPGALLLRVDTTAPSSFAALLSVRGPARRTRLVLRRRRLKRATLAGGGSAVTIGVTITFVALVSSAAWIADSSAVAIAFPVG